MYSGANRLHTVYLSYAPILTLFFRRFYLSAFVDRRTDR